jgi:hypothetical protein
VEGKATDDNDSARAIRPQPYVSIHDHATLETLHGVCIILVGCQEVLRTRQERCSNTNRHQCVLPFHKFFTHGYAAINSVIIIIKCNRWLFPPGKCVLKTMNES